MDQTDVPPGPPGYRGAGSAAPDGITPGVWVADLSQVEEVVVFSIGMRINRWRKVNHWWWVVRAMPRMLRELSERPDSPLLSYQLWFGGRDLLVTQVWRSAEELGAFARDPGATHAPAWREFNRRAAGTADVGIWHETYVCRPDSVESLYGNLPPTGLGRALGLAPVGSRTNSAAEQRVQGGPDKALAP